jgi:putative ABC transport system permease protein
MMNELIQDLKYGIRKLTERPVFTLTAVITLALGIGANSAVFTVVSEVLIRPLPYKDPGQLVVATNKYEQQGHTESGFSILDLDDLKQRCDAFENISLIAAISGNLTGGDRPERIHSRGVTPDFFEMLGVSPALGRFFTSADYQPGITEMVVLSHGLWERRFGRDAGVIGRRIRIDGDSYEIIGVMPPEFRHPGPETEAEVEVWYPAGFKAAPFPPPARSDRRLAMVARLKPGVTLRQAQDEVDAAASALRAEFPDAYPSSGWRIELSPLSTHIVGEIRPALLILMGAVGCVLLISCTNVANLLLVRASEREQEVAIRSALGAGSSRLIRQFLTESVLLSMSGGALGFLLAVMGVKVLVALKPADVPRLGDVTRDPSVLLFTMALAVVTGVAFGIYPAVYASRVNLNETLKESGRATSGSVRRNRMRSLLAVAGFAFTAVLLIGAGLLIRSFMLLQRVDPGFDTSNVLTMELAIPYPNQPDAGKYVRGPKRVEFYRQILDRVREVPTVQLAGLTSILPLSGVNLDRIITVEGPEVRGPGDEVHAEMRAVSPEYFKAMGIQLVAGRHFTEFDNAGAPGVAIVNETMARRLWPDRDALDKRFKLGGALSKNPWLSIVGIVRDVKSKGLDSEPQSEMFLSYAQSAPVIVTLVARATGNPSQVLLAMEDEVRSLDPDQPVFNVRTMEELMAKVTGPRRFSMFLFGVFAAIALVLAAVGIYGVISYSVSQRTHEIGIRMALGAGHSQIVRLVVGQALLLGAIGLGIGLVAAFLLTHLMSRLLFGIGPSDPATFGIVSLIMLATVLLASYVPGRRAARVDPVIALRGH